MTKRKQPIHWQPVAIAVFCAALVTGAIDVVIWSFMRAPKPPPAECFQMRDEEGVHTFCGHK